MATYYTCGKCGKLTEVGDDNGWLIAQRKGEKAGHLIIRCPEHVTAYALTQAGIAAPNKRGGRPRKPQQAV